MCVLCAVSEQIGDQTTSLRVICVIHTAPGCEQILAQTGSLFTVYMLLNPLSPNIQMHILLTILYVFLMLLVGRI